MTDARPRVNRPIFAADRLVKDSSSPGNKRTELVRIDQEINNESDGCEHEYQVSHGMFPVPTC